MGYDFEWSFPSSGQPVVSISATGFNFSAGAIQLLGKPEKVMIGFDAKSGVVGIKPIELNEGDDAYGYEFAKKERQGNIRISNRAFVKRIADKTGYDFSKTRTYYARWNDNERILLVDIMGPGE